MKFPKPFYRLSKRAWYVEIGKRQLSLGKDRAEAFRRYQAILLQEPGHNASPDADLTVVQVADLFLDWCQRHNAASTYSWYKDFLQDFCTHHGGILALQLKPFHVTRWLDRHTGWNDSTRRCAITAVKRVFNWAHCEGLVTAHPLKNVRKPAARCRERILTPAERGEILVAIKDQPFRDFIVAMQETGCRPSAVARVTADDVPLDDQHPDRGLWVLQQHKTRHKTGKPRVVILTPSIVELTRRLMVQHPTGPLFRGPRGGRPFSRNGIRCRFRTLRKKLPHLKGVIAYTYRHSYATDARENGVGIVQVAELPGHQGVEMVMRHYQHIGEKREHLRQAAIQATRPPAL